MIIDQEVLKDMAKNNFQDHYKEEGEYSPWKRNNRFLVIKESAFEEVEKSFSDDEIRSAVFNIGSFKAPKSDGLHPNFFFQANWPTIGSSICDTVRSCYYERDRIQEINNTLLDPINIALFLEDMSLIMWLLLRKFSIPCIIRRGEMVSWMLKWILKCLPIDEFSPSSRVKQDDPISPYFFVLCMEKLAHLIKREVAGNNWKPIKLCRTGLSMYGYYY
ncbi:hypothetical protein CR513_12207, partial [Mucuna pruriens]